MLRINLLWFLLLWVSFACAQNTIEGTVGGLGSGRVYLLSIYGEKTKAIDSLSADNRGHFIFTLSNRLPGMYRVKWGKEDEVDLIWNQENIRFATVAGSPDDSLRILSSTENRIIREYMQLDRTNQSKLQLLMQVIDFYPVKDSFYALAVKEFESTQKNQDRYVDSLARLYPGSFAVRTARAYQTPYVSSGLGKEERINYLKQHYFDRFDFADTALLRSMVFVNKAISYLSLYSNNRLPQKQLEAEFIKAVTIMLGAASVNPVIYKFWLDYLVGGFDKYHFDEVITYIADNFQDPSSCEDQDRKSTLQKKLDNFKKLAVGKTAPELEAPDSTGKPVRLTETGSEFTLVVFYASTCPHCEAMMPRLKEIYDKQNPKRFEVMAVSIDTSRAAWTGFLREQKLHWINVSDLRGFNGKPADDYNIYATPTMFLLDREKKILSKPVSLMELEQTLRDHNLVK